MSVSVFALSIRSAVRFATASCNLTHNTDSDKSDMISEKVAQVSVPASADIQSQVSETGIFNIILKRYFLCVSAQSFKEFSQLLNTVEEERRRLVSLQFLSFYR